MSYMSMRRTNINSNYVNSTYDIAFPMNFLEKDIKIKSVYYTCYNQQKKHKFWKKGYF